MYFYFLESRKVIYFWQHCRFLASDFVPPSEVSGPNSGNSREDMPIIEVPKEWFRFQNEMLYFETPQMQLKSKIKAKFRTFWLLMKINEEMKRLANI